MRWPIFFVGVTVLTWLAVGFLWAFFQPHQWEFETVHVLAPIIGLTITVVTREVES